MEALLRTLQEHGAFDNQAQMVGGIAQRAIDNGFDSLSEAQKQVLEPFIEMNCTGVTDPGGHHNGCDKLIPSEDLAQAIELSEDGIEGVQCEDCRDEAGFYQHQWERIERE
ncbi:hypothetical protein ACT0HP_003563 [Vibrio parahaemolyticus]|nr:hypothetical protein [Vibrio parahaemolyticus]